MLTILGPIQLQAASEAAPKAAEGDPKPASSVRHGQGIADCPQSLPELPVLFCPTPKQRLQVRLSRGAAIPSPCILPGGFFSYELSA